MNGGVVILVTTGADLCLQTQNNAAKYGVTPPEITKAPLVLHLCFRSPMEKIDRSIIYAKLNNSDFMFKNGYLVTLQLSVGDPSFRIRMGSLEKPCSGTLEQWPRGLDTLKQIVLDTFLRYPSLE